MRVDPRRRRDSLVVLTSADNPRFATSSHPLDDIDTVRFVRGERDAFRRERTLVLALPDERMSREHGHLVRGDTGWTVEDPSSRNASIVDGVVTRRAALHDGALLELGHTFLMLCKRPVSPPGVSHLARDVLVDELEGRPSLRTFSADLAHCFAALLRLATSTVSIVLLGETGTGKELVARAIHDASARPGDMVAINCGALPQTLLEAELFGHRRGAFSGAANDRRGLIRSADRGTLFLDEVGDLPRPSQVALLRVLQQREVLPLGEDRAIPVDIRIVSATLHPLDDGAFRSDLYARLAGHVAALPPLRDRREDLGILVATLLDRAVSGDVRFSTAALRALLRYRWPLNIRELEQALTTAVALATEGVIDLDHLPRAVRDGGERGSPSPPAHLLGPADLELRARLEILLAEHRGNVWAVATVLGKRRSQIYKWVHRFAIDLVRFRSLDQRR